MMTAHVEHIAAKLAVSVVGFAAIAGAALIDITTASIDAQTLVAYTAGLLGTGGLFWRVWADRSSTIRADGVQDKRIADMQSRLDDLEKDRDFWRDRALAKQQDKQVE